MKIPYKVPKLGEGNFSCPHCKVLSDQNHFRIIFDTKNQIKIGNHVGMAENVKNSKKSEYWDLVLTVCNSCKKYTVWEKEKIIFPAYNMLPYPNEDMPENVKEIYHESRAVYPHSKRASAALLRLSIEKLLPQLDNFNLKSTNLNGMIGELRKKDVPDVIIKGLDAIRISGNDGIHTGEIIFEEEESEYLFDLVNLVVEKLITDVKRIENFYRKLPENKRKGVKNRDNS